MRFRLLALTPCNQEAFAYVTGVVLPHSRSDLYSRCNYKVTSTYRTPCSLVASSTSATVTIAHKHQLSINERRMICHLLVDDI